MELLLLFVKGDRGLFAVAPYKPIYFPDKDSDITEPGLYECEVTLQKEHYAFVKGKRCFTQSNSEKVCYTIQKRKDDSELKGLFNIPSGFIQYKIDDNTTVYVDQFKNMWYIGNYGGFDMMTILYTTYNNQGRRVPMAYLGMLSKLEEYRVCDDTVLIQNAILAYVKSHTIKYQHHNVYPYLAILSCMNADTAFKYRFRCSKNNITFDVIGDFVVAHGVLYDTIPFTQWYLVENGAVYDADLTAQHTLDTNMDWLISKVTEFDKENNTKSMCLGITYKEIADFRRSNLISGIPNEDPKFINALYDTNHHEVFSDFIKFPIDVDAGNMKEQFYAVDPRAALSYQRNYDEDDLIHYLDGLFLLESKEKLMRIQKHVTKMGGTLSRSIANAKAYRTDAIIGYEDM